MLQRRGVGGVPARARRSLTASGPYCSHHARDHTGGTGAATGLGAGLGDGLTSGRRSITTGHAACRTIWAASDPRRRRAERVSASVPMKISEAAASSANSTIARAG